MKSIRATCSCRSSTASITCGRSTGPTEAELPQYLVQDNHEGIVTREVFCRGFRPASGRGLLNFHPGTASAWRHPLQWKNWSARAAANTTAGGHNSGKIAWQCSTYMIRGKDYCAAKQIS